MVKKDVRRYAMTISLLLIFFVAYLIIKPILTALLASFVIAYLFYPLHKKLKSLIKNETASALIIILIILIIILIPLALVANVIIGESINFYKSGSLEKISLILTNQNLANSPIYNFLVETLDGFIDYTKTIASNFLSSVPKKILDLLIILFSTFYLLLDGKTLINKIKKVLPITKKDELIKHLSDATNSIIYGILVTAIIEVVIAAIGFKILNISSPFIWAVMVGFLAFIPMIGPSVVWGPMAIIKFIQNDYISFIGVLILGAILSFIDTFLKPKFMGHKAKINPVIILIGIIGGLKLMGFVGLIIGPLILSSISIIIKEYYPKDET